MRYFSSKREQRQTVEKLLELLQLYTVARLLQEDYALKLCKDYVERFITSTGFQAISNRLPYMACIKGHFSFLKDYDEIGLVQSQKRLTEKTNLNTLLC